ncbi:hypothetical protein ACN2CC_28065 [Mesorhizobium muleiense]|uniref:oxidoreductase n=1 Tax=Mesorhizobium muleiense TaxID=1004279 RepID=UPI003AFA1682
MIYIGDQRVGSRFCFAPVNTGFCRNGEPEERLVKFHRERSGPEIAISYVGNVAISPEHRTNDATGYMDHDLSKWRRLSAAIDDNESLPGIQIACRAAPDKAPRKWRNDRRTFVESARQALTSMPEATLDELWNKFIRAAEKASEAGFKIIQIHAAHGYLLSQLMNRLINVRRDQFGGGINALERMIQDLRNHLPDTILDIRVNLFDGLEEPNEELSYRIEQIGRLIDAGCNMISLSSGIYDIDKFAIYPEASAGNSVYVEYARKIALLFERTKINVAGNIRDVVSLKDTEPLNLMFSIGRPLIADPGFIKNALTGKNSTECIWSGHCHYYSRMRPHIECKVNKAI